MGFLEKVKEAAQKPQASSWFETEPKVVNTIPTIAPTQHPPISEQASATPEGRVWIYPQQKKNENNAKHKIPYRLEKAILKSYDFQNWFETVWMVLNLNNRWTLNEVFIPAHLCDQIGATKVTVEENKKTGDIVWGLQN